jgi:hypothetical protein
MTTARLAIGLGAALLLAAVGCGRTDSTTATPPNTGTGMTGIGNGQAVTGPDANTPPAGPNDGGAGGAPTYGDATGTGFHTGDAAHSDGQGSGLMGFHGTGALGTSAAISDMHPTDPPAKNAPQPVLPEQ